MRLDQACLVLVVDDCADNAFLLQYFLESVGYRVETALSGKIALEKIQRSPPDLVLLDVMMPDISGLEVTRQLRQNNHIPLIPILLITASQEIDLKQALASGANDYLRKPIDLDELLVRVSTWCC